MGLLAISLTGIVPRNSPIAGIFFAQLFPQLVGFAVWALALTAISQKQTDLQFRSVQGMAHQFPVATTGLAIASFSLAGLPLLASFPAFFSIWSSLADYSLTFTVGSLFGCVLLFASALRSVAVLVMSPEPTSWKFAETGFKPILLATGSLVLFLLGLFPQTYMSMLTNLAAIFIFQGP
jgi:NADH:ubiquinone oxidoreductase subunit 2 (subunit N)